MAKTGGGESTEMSRNENQQHLNDYKRLSSCISISVFSFQFSFPVSISFPFSAFPYAQLCKAYKFCMPEVLVGLGFAC